MPVHVRNPWRIAAASILLAAVAVCRPALAGDRLQTDPAATPYLTDVIKLGGAWTPSRQRNSYVMADIDGDGVKELVEGQANRVIGMDAEDGRVSNRWQINLDPGWVLEQRPVLGVAADLDRDGIDEIFTSIANPETGAWNFAALSPATQSVLYTSPLPTGPDRRADGVWDGRYQPYFLLENTDGRGRPGILFAREVGYDAYPRGLVAVDPFTGQIIWEWLCGPNIFLDSVRLVDMGPDGQGIVFFGNAPDNLGGKLVNGTSDDRGRVFLVSSRGKTVWSKEMGSGFSTGSIEVHDFDGDGQEEIVAFTISGTTNVPNELVIWNWRRDKPLARTRSQAAFYGVAVMDGPKPGAHWLVTGTDQGVVIRYLYADGKLVQDARALGTARQCRLTGSVDILPSPGPEILVTTDGNDDFFLLNRDLETLAFRHDERHLCPYSRPEIWPLAADRKALVAGGTTGYMVMEMRPRPLAWGPLLARAGIVFGGMVLLWGAFLFGRRYGRRQQEAGAGERPADREALYRLWLEVDDVKHERLFEPNKGFRRLVWLLNAFTTEIGASADLIDRIARLMEEFRATDLPRLRGILGLAETEQIAPEVVSHTSMVLASAVGKLDALAEGELTVARVQAVEQELASDLKKIEDGFLDLWRALGEFYTADPVKLIQGLLLMREMEFRRAGIAVTEPKAASGPRFLCRIDSSALRYVLGNLVDNAMRAVADSERREISLHLERRDLEILITVRDSGRGIPEEDRERIFSGRFSSRGGGQGLFRSREILHRWRGEIELTESSPESGTTFTVVLPVAVKNPASAALKLV